MSTSRFAPLTKGAQVSAEALASAIAGMSADDLKASLTAEQLAALAPAPAPAASEEDAGDKPKKAGKGKKDKMEAEDGEYDDEEDEPMAQDRAAIVYASEHSQGRERFAADCLASFPTATGAQIVAFLAKQGKPEANAQAPEGTAELAAAIRHNNANLGAGGGAEPQADASAIWDKAIKANNPHLNR
jgi:hypothetical protein